MAKCELSPLSPPFELNKQKSLSYFSLDNKLHVTKRSKIDILRGIPKLFLAKFESLVGITFPEFDDIVVIVKLAINRMFNTVTAKKCQQYLNGYNYLSDESVIIPFYIAYLKLQHNILVDVKNVKNKFVIRINNYWLRQNNPYLRIRYLCGNFY